MKCNDYKTPNYMRSLELEWHEYLLRDEQRVRTPGQIPTSNNKNVYYAIAVMFAIFGLISYIISYFL